MKELYDMEQSNISLLNAVIESTADGIIVISNDERIIKVNRKFSQLFNIPARLIQTNRIEEIITFISDQIEQPELLLKKNLQQNNLTEESLVTLQFKDDRIFEVYTIPYRVGEDTVGHVFSFRDVTKQKQIEKNLSKEKILIRTIIDNLPDSIYVKDLDFRKTLANPPDLKNMGCSNEAEIIGKTDFDFFSKEAAQAFYNDDKEVVETGRPVINREESFIDKDGHKNWLLTTKLPLADNDGKIMGLIGVGRDITARKKNELIREALYEISESVLVNNDMATLYQKIHEAVSNLMSVKNFYIAIYNDKTNLLSFPYMVDEVNQSYPTRPLGNGLTEFILRQGVPALIDKQKILELHKSGVVELKRTPAEITLGVPLKDENKVLGVVVVRDYVNPKAYGNDEMQLLGFISEQIAHAITRKRNEEAIDKYVADLNELNQTKDKFFSIIAHDLKNPFVTLLGFSEILLSDFNELQSDEILFYINEMKKSADLSHNLLQNLLQWSRSQTGKIEFHPKQIKVNSIVQQNISLLKKSAEKKGINLIDKTDSNVIVKADEDMLNTIIRNLLTNAIKFTNKNGIISVTSDSSEEYVEIHVKDTGIGMDPNSMSKLFRLDVSHSTVGTGNESGTGLGLILCKEFVEKQGGKIWVDSQKGEGTTFTFSLPLK